MSFRFDVATANIKNSLTVAQVQSDVQKIANIADVIGWQEILPDAPGDHDESIAGLAGWAHAGLGQDNVPISWKTNVWELANERVWETIFPRPDKNPIVKHFRQVLLKHVASGQHIRFMNTHFIYKVQWDEPRSPENAEYRDAWEHHWREMNSVIDNYRDGGGWPIVGTGDYNRKAPDTPLFDANQKYITPGGIDQIWVIPKGRFAAIRDVTDLNGDVSNNRFNTDHGPDIWRVEFA